MPESKHRCMAKRAARSQGVLMRELLEAINEGRKLQGSFDSASRFASEAARFAQNYKSTNLRRSRGDLGLFPSIGHRGLTKT